MNSSSQCIFDILHVVKTFRDTLEYIVPKDTQAVEAYEARKKIFTTVSDPNSFIGKFIEGNKDKLSEFKKKYDEFLVEIFGENSSILVKEENNIRVDHAQNIKILDYVIDLSETLRDTMFFHLNYAKQQNMFEEPIAALIAKDEHFDRVLKVFVLLQEYNRSFMEFQKVMNESKGQPTPQSNYIVTNELSKMSGMIRVIRAHVHFTDNKTLDALDEAIELLEMCEGRRDRRDNKNFPDLFKSCLESLSRIFNEYAVEFQKDYDVIFKEMVEAIKKNSENKENAAKA